MLPLRLALSSSVLALFALAGCSSQSPSDPAQSAADAGGPSANGSDAGASSSTVAGTLPFHPSNGVDLGMVDLANATDEISMTGDCRIDSEQSTIQCGSRVGKYAAKIVTLADHSRVSLFVSRSIRIETSTTVRTYGAIPVVLAALDDISVFGTLIVRPGTSGGAAVAPKYQRGAGSGGGTAASVSGLGGGGASFCGLGGRAASAAPAIPEPSATYGTPELVPLVGGSAGGVSFFDNGSDPSGGGALQLLAGKSIVIGASGAISLPGGGGDLGSDQVAGPGMYGAGGGGSGGALLIEAPTVQIDGTLAANGGAGGGASQDATPGGYGTAEARAATGGIGKNLGGDGSSATVVAGGAGVWDAAKVNASGDPAAASGGGGGAGRIRINTSSGHATITGVVSPALSTGCATEGTFRP